MPLSDVQIRSLKPRDRVYKVSDAHSLYIEVHPTGARLWRFKYTMHGKQKRIALGAYPTVGCQTAFKRDPRSASKRDPLFGYDAGLLKMALRCVRRRAGVARPEARAAQDRFLKAPKVAVSCGF